MPFGQTVYWILEIPESLKSRFSLFCAVSHLSICINSLADSFISGAPEILVFHHEFYFFLVLWSSSHEPPNVDLSNRYSTFCEFWGRRRGDFQASGKCSFFIFFYDQQQGLFWPSLSIWLNSLADFANCPFACLLRGPHSQAPKWSSSMRSCPWPLKFRTCAVHFLLGFTAQSLLDSLRTQVPEESCPGSV